MLRLTPVLLAAWLALLYAYAVPAEGTYGIDISSYLSINDFGCLKNNSYQFAIIRAYRSLGKTLTAAAGDCMLVPLHYHRMGWVLLIN